MSDQQATGTSDPTDNVRFSLVGAPVRDRQLAVLQVEAARTRARSRG